MFHNPYIKPNNPMLYIDTELGSIPKPNIEVIEFNNWEQFKKFIHNFAKQSVNEGNVINLDSLDNMPR